MKDNNRKTIMNFEFDNRVFKPVKNAISEELRDIIQKVAVYDHGTAFELSIIVDVILTHFHEDIQPIRNKDIGALDNMLYGLPARLEKAKMLLLKDGYPDKKELGSPVWYLDMALTEITRLPKLIKDKQKKEGQHD